jgi:hypothetical protein
MCQKCHSIIGRPALHCTALHCTALHLLLNGRSQFNGFITNASSLSDGEPLRFRGEVYHPYHFSCTGCKEELTATAREVGSIIIHT